MILSKNYDIIRHPVVTEKSTTGSAHGQVTFQVDRRATKPEIRSAVEKLFNVEVISVNTLNYRGKKKRFRGRVGYRKSTKKAIVTLREGHVIDVTVGV